MCREGDLGQNAALQPTLSSELVGGLVDAACVPELVAVDSLLVFLQ